jgi:pantoate--beta-alanine ligase
MEVVVTKPAARAAVEAARFATKTVGIVPTMGYLHEGHLSLARQARTEDDFVVLTIFVNPTQFGPSEDLARYPRDLERDLTLCREAGVDLVFSPSNEEMYGPDFATWVTVEGLTEGLCGQARPTHFRGVTTVVSKLFGICRAHRAYFGQKDAQQAFVIRRMTEDLDLGVEIVVCPTVREPDGLAMSSRNVNLSPEARVQAPALYRALQVAEQMVRAGERDAARVRAAVEEFISIQAPLGRIDYVEIADTRLIRPIARLEGQVLVALAVFFGDTRLIDNVILQVS